MFLAMIIGLFIMRPSVSLADWQGHNGDSHSHSGGSSSHNSGSSNHNGGNNHEYHHHDRNYIGVNFSFWPDNYYYSALYYPPDDQVLVSGPVYQPVVINGIT